MAAVETEVMLGEEGGGGGRKRAAAPREEGNGTRGG